MNNTLDNSTKWQNEYWKKISRQRSIENSFQPLNGKNKEGYDSASFGNNAGITTTYRMSFTEEHQEHLNPFTRNWRESLRAWSSKYNEYSNSPRNVNKQSNKQWLENERRKTSQKMEVLQFMSKG